MSDTTPPGKWLVFFFVAIGIFMSTLDGSIVNIALPTIMKDFSTDLTTVEWVVLIYLLTVSSLLLSFGRLSDIKGRRLVYALGLTVFSTGSLFCGAAGSPLFLIGARCFQGAGAAMIMACTPALVVDTFPASERGKALGMIGTVVALGLTAGPALGGLILSAFSWRVIFYINIPIGFSAALFSLVMLKGGRADKKRAEPFDGTGAFFLAISIASFLFGVTQAEGCGVTDIRVVLPVLLFILSTVVLLIWENRTAYPVLDISLFRIRLFGLPILSAVTVFMTLFIMIFLMPFYLTLPLGYSEARAGFVMVIPFFFLFIISPISGALSDRLGSRLLCTFGMAILTLALFCLATLTVESGMGAIAWRMALAGIGTAVFLPPNSATAMTALPADKRGLAAGVVATARNFGMVLGVAMAGVVFNHYYQRFSGGMTLKSYAQGCELIFIGAFRRAMTAGAMVAAAGMVVSFLRGSEEK